MNSQRHTRPLSLPIILGARSVYRIERGKGRSVRCLKGPVWITQENDPRDIILSSGQSFLLDRRGLAVIFALREAVIQVDGLEADQPGRAGTYAAVEHRAA